MSNATRNVGSSEVKLRQGHPTLRQNLDFCYFRARATTIIALGMRPSWCQPDRT